MRRPSSPCFRVFLVLGMCWSRPCQALRISFVPVSPEDSSWWSSHTSGVMSPCSRWHLQPISCMLHCKWLRSSRVRWVLGSVPTEESVAQSRGNSYRQCMTPLFIPCNSCECSLFDRVCECFPGYDSSDGMGDIGTIPDCGFRWFPYDLQMKFPCFKSFSSELYM